MERDLIARYEADIDELLERLSFLRLPQAVEIGRLPESVRGFGHVKMRNVERYLAERERLLAAWRASPDVPGQAAPARAA